MSRYNIKQYDTIYHTTRYEPCEDGGSYDNKYGLDNVTTVITSVIKLVLYNYMSLMSLFMKHAATPIAVY